MAPAIVHFLVGASLVLLVATPLALRGGTSRHHLWLVAIGGLWGLFPDLSHVTPVFRSELQTLHESRWADVFAFHYTLDQPPIDTHPLESTAAAILLFLGSVVVFTAASAVGERNERSTAGDHRTTRDALVTRVLVATYAVAVTALVTGITVGSILAETSHVEPLGTLVGRDSRRSGWILWMLVSLTITASFAILTPLVETRWNVSEPVRGVILAQLVAVTAWSTGVALSVPLWMRIVLDRPLPVPYTHWASLLALVGFGLVLGVVYPIVRRLVTPPTTPSTHRSRS